MYSDTDTEKNTVTSGKKQFLKCIRYNVQEQAWCQ